jgi:hypothetical protein
MISFTQKGSFKNTERYLAKLQACRAFCCSEQVRFKRSEYSVECYTQGFWSDIRIMVVYDRADALDITQFVGTIVNM